MLPLSTEATIEAMNVFTDRRHPFHTFNDYSRFRQFGFTQRNIVANEIPRVHHHVVGMLRSMTDINQPSLPTPFCSVFVSISVLLALSTVFFPSVLLTTLRFLTLFFRSNLCLSTLYFYVEVSFSPDVIPCG